MVGKVDKVDKVDKSNKANKANKADNTPGCYKMCDLRVISTAQAAAGA